MNPLALCAISIAAAVGAAVGAVLVHVWMDRRADRQQAAEAARVEIARLGAEAACALDPEAALLRMLTGHPELHDLAKGGDA